MRELYAEGARDPSEVSRRIVAALSPEVRTEMAGPGVAACLDTLLQATAMGPEALARRTDLSAGHSAAATVRALAERRIATGGWASRFSDIALDALGTCVVEALAPAADADLGLALSASCPRAGGHGAGSDARLLRCFMRADIERCFGYFVARDISEFVGLPALPDVAAATDAVRRVAGWCRSVIAAIPYGSIAGILPQYARLDDDRRLRRLQAPLGDMMQTGLDALAAGPGDGP